MLLSLLSLISILRLSRQQWTYLGVIFVQEMNDAHVIFKCDYVRLWESFKWRNIVRLCFERAKQVLGERDGIYLLALASLCSSYLAVCRIAYLEVSLEKQVSSVVNSPFTRLFNWCSFTH